MAKLARGFDIRLHLATKTRYLFRTPIPNAPSIYELDDPTGYEASYLYLVSRHGSRWPTSRRMKQINACGAIFKDAKNTKALPWLQDWASPLALLSDAGGELHPIGEEEMWGLASRLRRRFPSLHTQRYLPKKYPIVSTSVSRAAASASAFASAYFPAVPYHFPPPGREGREASSSSWPLRLRDWMLGSQDVHDKDIDQVLRPQAVAIAMAPKRSDHLLRFFDACPAYEELERQTEEWMTPWLSGNWSQLLPGLEQRLGMSRPLQPAEVDALWQLCLLEGGILNITDQACSLFERDEVLLLEWLDDVDLLEFRSYGAPLNYQIAAPLLRDMTTSLQTAATCRHRHNAEHSRLLFAHCETLVPLATLMGLFTPEGEEGSRDNPTTFKQHVSKHRRVVSMAAAATTSGHRVAASIDDATDLSSVEPDVRGSRQRDQDSAACSFNGSASGPQPPHGWRPSVPRDEGRLWRGSRVSPYGGNLAIVMYHKTGADRSVSNCRVRLLYNEQVVEVPGCPAAGESREYELQDFLDVMAPLAGDGSLAGMCGGSSSSSRIQDDA